VTAYWRGGGRPAAVPTITYAPRAPHDPKYAVVKVSLSGVPACALAELDAVAHDAFYTANRGGALPWMPVRVAVAAGDDNAITFYAKSPPSSVTTPEDYIASARALRAVHDALPAAVISSGQSVRVVFAT
jgi:hypothetical protein